jgi:excinuclease UvrABC nuclease subunit
MSYNPTMNLHTPLTGDLGSGAPRSGLAAHELSCRKTLRARCPDQPGVYVICDHTETAIYVGKSRTLRSRLATYQRAESFDEKPWRIMRAASALTWELWPDEFGCMLREIELIQTLRPRDAPRLVISTERPDRSQCLAAMGPLPSRRRLERVAALLNDHFRLATCTVSSASLFAASGRHLGCLRDQVSTGLGPCVGAASRADYAAQVEGARRFLMGKDLSPMRDAQTAMLAAAERMAFEDAALRRDEWLLLRWVSRRMRELRRAQRDHDFVYPVPTGDGAGTTWYLIRGGLVVAIIAAPRTVATLAAARALITQVFAAPRPQLDWPDTLAGENLALVTRWFRDHPEERARLLAPASALDACIVAGTGHSKQAPSLRRAARDRKSATS